MSKVLKSHIALLLVNLIYGANFSIVKEVVPSSIQSFALVVLRAGSAAILFWVTSVFLPKEKVARKDFIMLLLLGVFGVAINQLLFIRGLELSKPIDASIIMIFNPIIVLILEMIFLKEKVSVIRTIGIIVGISGASMLLVFKGDFSFSGPVISFGNMLIFINCISWAFFLVLVKPLMLKYRTVTIMKWVFAFGFVYVLPFGYPQLHVFDAAGIGFVAWACIGYILVASTYLAYFLNTYALAELTPSVASVYIYMQPVIATIIAIALKQDKPDAMKFVSAALVVVGIYLAGDRSRRRKNPEADIAGAEQ